MNTKGLIVYGFMVIFAVIATFTLTRNYYSDRSLIPPKGENSQRPEDYFTLPPETVRVEIPRLKAVIRHDTIRLKEDSLVFIPYMPNYYASADTTIKDRELLGDSISLNIKYYYPPLSFFQVDYLYFRSPRKQELPRRTVVQMRESFFSHGINLSAGYGLIQGKPDIYIGYGITINF